MSGFTGHDGPCKGSTAKRIPKMVRVSLSAHLREGGSCFPRNECSPRCARDEDQYSAPHRFFKPQPAALLGLEPVLWNSPCPLDKRKQTRECTVLALGRHAGHLGHSRTGEERGSATIGDGPTVLKQGAGRWGVEGGRDIVKHTQEDGQWTAGCESARDRKTVWTAG